LPNQTYSFELVYIRTDGTADKLHGSGYYLASVSNDIVLLTQSLVRASFIREVFSATIYPGGFQDCLTIPKGA